ncbi:hypothetical protein [Polaromonas sp. CG9_12]|nr:hypothetical protein [Polaromonas sp. CG9_12]
MIAQPALALVTDTFQPQATKSGPTAEERFVLADYVKDLKARGFCKLDSAASDKTQLYNRFDGQSLPLSFIGNDFHSWLYRNNKTCDFYEVAYILRTLRHVVGSKFIPIRGPYYVDPETRCTWINVYRAYQPTTDSAEVSPLFLDYLGRLAPDPAERKVMVQWLAHIFQRPGQRPSWHLMLPSDTGTGKGFLVEEILHPLLHHTSVVSSFSKITAQFSTLVEDNILVLLDDCKAKSDTLHTQLKSLLSEERQYVERKKLQGKMVQTYARFILASNEAKPLHLDESERRWFVLKYLAHRVDRAETQGAIRALADWLELPGSLCKVYNYFLACDLTDFNHKNPPITDSLRAIVEMGRCAYALFLEEYTADRKLFTRAELVKDLQEDGMSKPSDQHLPHLIRDAGYVRSRPVINGTQHSGIYHPVGMPLEEIRATLEAIAF